jgi:hypothetical protein
MALPPSGYSRHEYGDGLWRVADQNSWLREGKNLPSRRPGPRRNAGCSPPANSLYTMVSTTLFSFRLDYRFSIESVVSPGNEIFPEVNYLPISLMVDS